MTLQSQTIDISDVQKPMPTDSDSVYTKDIRVEHCIITDWDDVDGTEDSIAHIPFNNLHTRIENSVVTSPKTLRIHFNRTISAHQLWLWSYGGWDFSNVKITLLWSWEVEREVVDDSSDNTKYTSKNFPFNESALFNAVEIEFATTDIVTISNITIQKAVNTTAQIQGQRSDWDQGTVWLTNWNNIKVSLEEFETEFFDATPLPVTNIPNDNPTLDAFSRLRVSNTGQRFDCEFIYDKQPSLFEENLSWGSTCVHNSDSRDVTLAIANAVDWTYGYLCQRRHNPYTPGNSQLIDITGTLNESDIAWGTCEIFHKNGIDSSETVYLQSAWSENVVADVDFAKSQIFMIDFQSLKIWRVRFFLNRWGAIVTVHEITNDNIRLWGYRQYPQLPLCYRIYNTATETITEIGYFDDDNWVGFRYRVPVNATAKMRCICSTVKSEGGQDLFDIPWFNFIADTGIVEKTVSSTMIPIMSIRPKTTFNSIANRSITIPTALTVQSDNPVQYKLLINATLTGASWADVNTNSATEYDTSATVVSGGSYVEWDYIATWKNIITSLAWLLWRGLLSYSDAWNQTTLTLVAIKTGWTDAEVLANIKFKEIR